ncbi:DUF4397 domain-containing protein [Halohasta salina]|uniref:DUF4397 domain-containing protein n=1 Tax=Halohasta salina TaxID=2961621 RepID=UPI0020A58889|nr:DUF4397 domain-containing protein [Halohasta salina]
MRHTPRRELLKTAGATLFIGGLAGCADQGTGNGQPGNDTDGGADDDTGDEGNGGEGDEPSGEGAFRAVHASPDAPNVDVYFDEEAVVEDLAFGEVSPYAAVEPNTYQLQVTAAGDADTVVFDEEITVEADRTATAVAFGEAAGGPETGFTVEILDDDIADPGEEDSRLRLFHASPDAGPVDVSPQPADGGGNETAGGSTDPLVSGLAFGETGTATVPAGDYTLDILPADGDEPVASVDLSAAGGTVYSAFAIGYVDPEAAGAGSEAAFELLVVEDAVDGERADGGTDEGLLAAGP